MIESSLHWFSFLGELHCLRSYLVFYEIEGRYGCVKQTSSLAWDFGNCADKAKE